MGKRKGFCSVPFFNLRHNVEFWMHLAQALPNLTLLSRKAELRSFVPESQIPATLENSHRVLALLTKLTTVCYRSSMPSTAHCAALRTFYQLIISVCEAFLESRQSDIPPHLTSYTSVRLSRDVDCTLGNSAFHFLGSVR